VGVRTVTEAEDRKFATDLLAEYLRSEEGRETDLVYACGPWPMMARASAICAEAGVACRAFLEKRMECGVGVCMSCVCRRQGEGGEWEHVRVCREGTVFDASRIRW
jgi:dihydroorotate dehydrogenase electron transfer subunit